MFVQEKTLVLYTEDKRGKTSLNNSKGTKLDEQRAQSWAEEPLAAGGLRMAPTQPQLTSVNQYWMSLVQKKKRRIPLLQELSSYREGSWAKAGISLSSKDPLWEGLRRGEAEPLKVHKAVRMVSVWPLWRLWSGVAASAGPQKGMKRFTELFP